MNDVGDGRDGDGRDGDSGGHGLEEWRDGKT